MQEELVRQAQQGDAEPHARSLAMAFPRILGAWTADPEGTRRLFQRVEQSESRGLNQVLAA